MAVNSRHHSPWSMRVLTLAPNAISVRVFSEPPFSSIKISTLTLIAMSTQVTITRCDGIASRTGAGGGGYGVVEGESIIDARGAGAPALSPRE
jgi:hypothetical protein